MPSCPSCTFDNPPAASTCQVCETPLEATTGPTGMVRHPIDADNSCLFNAVGYLCEGALRPDLATELRAIVAAIVQTDTERFTEGILGRTTEEYVAYIQRPAIWGGGLELEILSTYYEVSFVAVDIVTCKPFVFGGAHPKCAYLLFSGTHYDAIVRKNADGSEVRTFPIGDEEAAAGALGLAKAAHSRGAFTDLQKFTLLCLDCHVGVVGQKEAVEHAKATGHVNFGEYAVPK